MYFSSLGVLWYLLFPTSCAQSQVTRENYLEAAQAYIHVAYLYAIYVDSQEHFHLPMKVGVFNIRGTVCVCVCVFVLLYSLMLLPIHQTRSFSISRSLILSLVLLLLPSCS
jgi:hypothetical protein